MSEARSLEAFLDQANEKEKSYDWLAAVDFYGKASSLVLGREDFLKAGEIRKRIGHCFCRAAFQAETNEEFQLRLRKAHRAYLEAAKHCQRVGDRVSDVRAKHCEAMASYTASRLVKDPTERTSLLDHCIKLEEQSLKESEETKEMTLLSEILANLLHVLNDRVDLEASPEKRKKLLRKALTYGEDTEKLSPLIDPEILVDCLVSVAYHRRTATFIFPSEQTQGLNRKIAECCKRALELAEASGNKELLAEVIYADVYTRLMFEDQWGSETSLRGLERVVTLAKQTGNKQILAIAYSELAGSLAFGRFQRESDPKRLRRVIQKVEDFAARAIRLFTITGDEGRVSVVHGYVLASLYDFIGEDLENTYDKIIEAQERSVKHVKMALELADKSGSTFAIFMALLHGVVFRYHLIKVTKDPEERLNLLRETSRLGRRAVDFSKNLYPNLIQIGAVLSHYAAVKADLTVFARARA